MAINIPINVEADTSALDKITTGIEGVDKELGQLEKAAGKAEDSLEDLGDAGGKSADEIKRELKNAADEFRTLDKEAKETGANVGDYFKDAADEIENNLEDFSKTGESEFEKVEEAAEDAAKKIDRDLTEALEEAGDKAKDSGKKIGDGIKDGTDKAGEGFEDLKSEANQSAKEAAASFSGDPLDALDFLQETAANALSGFGPAGAAAGLAAAIGIGLAQAKLQEIADKTNEAKERMGELALEFAEAGTGFKGQDFTDTIREWAFEIQDARSWFELWQTDAVNNFENVQRAASEAGVDLSEFWAALTEGDPSAAFDYLDTLIEKRDTLNQQASDILDNQTVVSQADRDAAMALEDQSAAYNDLINELKPVLEERKKAYDQSVTLRAAEEQVSEEYIRQRDAIDANNEEIEENNRLKDEAVGAAMNALTAQDELTASISTNTALIAENGIVVDQNGNALEGMSDKALAGKEALVDIASSARDSAEAFADSGKTQAEVNGLLQQGYDAFVKEAVAMGYSEQAARDLATGFGLLPNDVSVPVEVTGTDQAQTDIEGVQGTAEKFAGKDYFASVKVKADTSSYDGTVGSLLRKTLTQYVQVKAATVTGVPQRME